MPATPYLVRFLAAVVLTVALVPMANLHLDPFGVFGNSTGGIYKFEERAFKARQAATYPHDVLLLGSSKTAVFDPDHLPGARIFNGAFAAAQPQEILRFLEDYGGTARTVVIGLDPYMFNQYFPAWRQSIFRPRGWREVMHYTFSFQVLLAGIDGTARRWLGQPPLVQADGQWNRADWDRRQEAGGDFAPERTAVLRRLARENYRNFTFAEVRVETLRRIRRLLERRGQGFRVFINPLEVCALALFDAPRRAAELGRFRAAVREVFPEALDYSASAYSVPANFYAFDPYHLRTSVSARLIGEVLAGRPPEPMPRDLDCQI